ncbi:hypothetical protein Tco_0663463, partial [Tanacetum coccineum]
MSPPIRRKYRDSVAFATGCRKIKNCKRCNRKIRIPIGMWPCKVEEKMTLKKVDGKTVKEIETKIIAKDGTITRIPGQFQGYETSEEEPVEQPEKTGLYFSYVFLTRKKSRWGTVFPTGLKRYKEPLVEPKEIGYFDVIVGMDWLSKRKFGIVCHEKVVRIPLEGDEILRVHGEHLVPGATPVAKSPYCLASLEMQELSKQLQELQDKESELLRKEKLYAKSSVKDKILATSNETSKVENAPAEILRNLDQQMEKRVDDGKANMVIEALSRKERVKPKCVRAMAMTIQYGILLAESVRARRWDLSTALCILKAVGQVYAPFEALYGRKCRSPVLWAEIRESSLIGPELVQETTDKVVLIKEKLKAARDCQKSCVDNRRKPLEFEVGERVMLKVSPWKGVIRFGKKGLHVSLDEIEVDKTLCFVEEPVENSDCEVMRLKCSRMVIVKVRFWLEARSLRLQVILTLLTRLELAEEQYLRLLPQTSVTCVLNFHMTSPALLAAKDVVIAAILKKSELKDGQYVFDIPAVACSIGLQTSTVSQQLQILKLKGEITYELKDPSYCYMILNFPKDICSLASDLAKWLSEVESCK